ncbi:MAG: hypothetical protein J6T70_15635 [Bacteroidales bacterium]|nr:hypothetical protein [Bacteroidales bacterium]MBO7598468.1 hypothetical protein [Bacteroidales bacterium]
MKKKITIALLAITSAVLVFALSSCKVEPANTSDNQCYWAKHVKDSVINAVTNVNP